MITSRAEQVGPDQAEAQFQAILERVLRAYHRDEGHGGANWIGMNVLDPSLVPVAPAEPGPHPDDVDPRDGLESAVAATAELLVAMQRRGADVERLEAENAKLRKKRKLLKRRLRAAEDD